MFEEMIARARWAEIELLAERSFHREEAIRRLRQQRQQSSAGPQPGGSQPLRRLMHRLLDGHA